MATWVFDINGDSADGTPGTLPVLEVDSTGALDGGVNGPGVLWWDRVHVHARSINVGNVATQVVVTLDIFNAYRDDDRTWDGLTINANGVTTNAPTLPITLEPLEGLELEVTIAADGAALVDGDLTFEFEGGATVVVPLSFRRLEAFVAEPEADVLEELAWLTTIIPARDGTEQRMARRRRPRQSFTYEIAVENGTERARVENFLFDQVGKAVGVPAWMFQTKLTAAASPSDETLNVAATTHRDFRVGGQAVLLVDPLDYEIVNVDSLTATTLATPAGGISGSFAAGTLVMPLRTAYLESVARSSRQHIGEARYTLTFHVIDNDVEIADASAFSSYNGRPLLDGPNFFDVVDETYERQVVLADGGAGLIQPFTLQEPAWRRSGKAFSTESPQELWEVRQLLHYLEGRQGSFYLPTFAKEMVPAANITNGTAQLDVEHVGYTAYAQERQPKDVIRLVEFDGTAHIKTVSGSSELSSTVERLTVSPVWGSDVAAADVERIEFLEKARSDSDRVQIRHRALPGDADVSLAVHSVLE